MFQCLLVVTVCLAAAAEPQQGYSVSPPLRDSQPQYQPPAPTYSQPRGQLGGLTSAGQQGFTSSSGFSSQQGGSGGGASRGGFGGQRVGSGGAGRGSYGSYPPQDQGNYGPAQYNFQWEVNDPPSGE